MVAGMHEFRAMLALLLALLVPATAGAAWLKREEAIMGTRCAVELWSDDLAAGGRIAARAGDMRRQLDLSRKGLAGQC